MAGKERRHIAILNHKHRGPPPMKVKPIKAMIIANVVKKKATTT
jgi:hypothetical protein